MCVCVTTTYRLLLLLRLLLLQLPLLLRLPPPLLLLGHQTRHNFPHDFGRWIGSKVVQAEWCKYVHIAAHAFYILCIASNSNTSRSCNPKAETGQAAASHACRCKARDCGPIVDFTLCVCRSWTVDLGQWAHCRLRMRPLTSKSVAVVLHKAGHGHCKTADPQNYDCHT